MKILIIFYKLQPKLNKKIYIVSFLIFLIYLTYLPANILLRDFKTCGFITDFLKLSSSSVFLTLLNVNFIERYVLYGEFNNTQVVLKYNAVIKECDILSDYEKIEYFKNKYTNYESLILCPKPFDINELLKPVPNNSILCFSEDNISEGILLQILPADQYPVPIFYNHCKGLLMTNYIGLSLINYYYDNWLMRARIVKSCLRLAEIFTYGHQKFIFYFSDLSPDNLVVDKNYNVFLVDLDHAVIVDREAMPKENIESWMEVHESKYQDDDNFDNSHDNFIFSYYYLCRHHLSDHNYYALYMNILKGTKLLPGGFLHDIPQELLIDFPEITDILEECVNPKFLNRFESARKLSHLLEIVTNQ